MANPIIGNAPQLESGYTFEEWTEVLEAWFTSNDIKAEDKQRALFLTGLGSKGYHTLRALVQPEKPASKTYKECKDALTAHYSPKPTEIVQRYRFYTCTQQANETIPQFLAKLRNLSDGCNFKELQNMLRDRLVVGCSDVNIQRKLLGTAKLTFENATNIAVAMEVAKKDVEQIRKIGKPQDDSTSVHQFQRKPQEAKTRTQAKGFKPKDKSYTPKKCWRCGGSHEPDKCKFRDEQCYKCSKKGHTKSQCDKVKAYQQKFYQKKKAAENKAHHLDDGDVDSSDSGTMDHLEDESVNKLINSDPYMTTMIVNGREVQLEVDTGCPWTIVPKQVYNEISSNSKPTSSHIKLKSYTGEKVDIYGEAMVDVQLEPQMMPEKLTLVVVEKGASLMGRDWLQKYPQLLAQIASQVAPEASPSPPNRMHNLQDTMPEVLAKHAQLFDNSTIGVLKGYQAKVHPQDGVEEACFYRAAPVPYAMRNKVDETLDELIKQGVIEPVKYADYACPIVVVQKPDGKVRICGNYKLTANKVLRVEQYPLPSLEDMLQDLEGGQKFSKLDLSHAYHQIELETEARQFTTINTHRGLFQYARLPFGIASAPALFQRVMETLLADIPMCRPYLDDIIVSGRNDEEHLANLEAVLDRLEENGLRLKKEKCQFMMDTVEFLGHKLDQQGIRPLHHKIEDILKASRPVNQSQLKAYLGLLGYYRRFLPNLSTEIAPLTELLKEQYASTNAKGRKKPGPDAADPKFIWGPNQEKAFKKSKQLLTDGQVLTHYDVKKPLLLQTDASPYGLGAVISHLNADGQEQPIAFASRTLTKAERNYAQYEKEGLSIIFGLKKFHKYLYGRPFTIITDHKPLLGLFGEKPTSPMASARVSRWQMILSAYDYSIEYKQGCKHQNADGLSRLPAQEDQSKWPNEDLDELDSMPAATVNLIRDIDSRPVEADEIKSRTRRDPVLSRVKSYIQNGWPEQRNLDAEFKPYSQKREELSVEDDIVLWGHRVVIPQDKDLRQRLVSELHATHPGIVKMKALARSYFWWPTIDKTLENCVRECAVCQEHQTDPPHAPIHPWEFPENPWSRIHIDYAFIDGQDVLIVVDAHSKWIEAVRVGKATATATITAMRRLFATHGIPDTIVSDNGTQFISEEFHTFLSNNGIEHVQTAPKHPSSNGLAERAVQTVKHGVKKTRGDNLEMRIQRFLLTYRLTPQATTGKSPSELLYKRKIRSKLDRVRPNLHRSVKRKQSAMKREADRKSKAREFSIGDNVLVKNFYAGTTWLRGKVVDAINETMYNVELLDGRQVRRHADHMRRYTPAREVDDHASREEATRQPPSPPLEVEQPEVHHPMPTEGEPRNVPYTREKPSSDTEHPIIDAESVSTPVHTEPVINSEDVALDSSETDNSMLRKRVSSRQTKTPSKFRDFVVYR